MRNIVIALVVFAVAFGLVRMRMQRANDERDRREEEAREQVARRQPMTAEEQQSQMQARFLTSTNCDTAINNRQVLHDVSTRGGTLLSFDSDRPPPKTPEEIRDALAETQDFIDQNCAEHIKQKRTSGYCSYPQFRDEIICRP